MNLSQNPNLEKIEALIQFPLQIRDQLKSEYFNQKANKIKNDLDQLKFNSLRDSMRLSNFNSPNIQSNRNMKIKQSLDEQEEIQSIIIPVQTQNEKYSLKKKLENLHIRGLSASAIMNRPSSVKIVKNLDQNNQDETGSAKITPRPKTALLSTCLNQLNLEKFKLPKESETYIFRQIDSYAKEDIQKSRKVLNEAVQLNKLQIYYEISNKSQNILNDKINKKLKNNLNKKQTIDLKFNDFTKEKPIDFTEFEQSQIKSLKRKNDRVQILHQKKYGNWWMENQQSIPDRPKTIIVQKPQFKL